MNRLAQESSPYLLQHKSNPVDWYPWGPEALQRSKAENKPIFLSIGYSACHWCHVMEHESFENERIAALLNEKFVNIKVDREERPDLDHLYMAAVQLMNDGRGGWPMSVFLTPELKPFYGGTYFPPTARMGMPGFDQVIGAVSTFWQTQAEDAAQHADKVVDAIAQAEAGQRSSGALRKELLHDAAAKLERVFDFSHGGFGRAPKFPHAMNLQLLLRIYRRWPRQGVLDMVRLNLDKMAQGGIYDHLAGGFARYSVDERWLVPHFEKMLYDNALLTSAYLDGYLATGESRYAQTARETCDYILNYMTDPEGGFHSTEDADSEGEEGKFYVWSPGEIKQILGDEPGERFCYVYDVSQQGNFEGCSILNLPKTIEQCASLKNWDAAQLREELAQSRAKLLEVRDRRVRPGKDDKILVNWNALMIDALARAAGVLDEPKYLAAARRAAEFLLANLRREDGRLLHCWRGGAAKLDAYLDDYAYLVNALVSLYQADFDERWIDEAVRLADIVMKHFADSAGGGFFFTADDHERLIARHKDFQDSSVPSGAAMAATALLRLGKLCGRNDYLEAAVETLETGLAIMEQSPMAAGQLLIALDMQQGPFHEIVIVGDAPSGDTAQLVHSLRKSYLPNCIAACRANPELPVGSPGDTDHLAPMFAGKTASAGSPTMYVCENFTCRQPAAGLEAAQAALEALTKGDSDG
ncbi:MAG: thioredoxin domain-containing protein [Pirellulaceae bacterium]